jgi:hypothetical protein
METKLRVCNALDTRADAWPFNNVLFCREIYFVGVDVVELE